MATAMTELALDVLNRGLDDWVYLAEVEYLIRTHYGDELPSSIKSRCIALIEHLLANKLVEVGDLTTVDGSVQFVSWNRGVDASLRELEQRWSRFGGPRDESGASDVCWLSNTEVGNAFVKERAESQ